MSDSIRGDYKFVQLLIRLIHEYEEIMASKMFLQSRRFCDTMGMSIDFVDFNDKIKSAEDKASITLNHVFKYIDRFVASKLTKERLDCQAAESKSSELQDVYHFINPRNFNADSRLELMTLLKKELSLINPLILNVCGFNIDASFNSTEEFCVILEFCHTSSKYPFHTIWSHTSSKYPFHTIWSHTSSKYPFHTIWSNFSDTFLCYKRASFPINLTRLAEGFVEKANKAVAEHASK